MIISTAPKAREFLDIIADRVGQDPLAICGYLAHMPDTDWDILLATIATNRTRDLNIGKFKLPAYSDFQRLALTEFIWINDTCGLHNSYWSRMWWMVKGGKLIKMFPPNAVLEAFERGERKVDFHIYKNRG